MSKKIDKIYSDICKDETCDIYYHMPTLKKYADECDIIYEFGVRAVVSTVAFLKSIKARNKENRKLISVDIDRWEPHVTNTEELCIEAGINWTFIQSDCLKIEIQECDMLLLDTIHDYEQVKNELRLHAGKVRKLICFHDTFTYAYKGQNYEKGIMTAINEFMEANHSWIKEYETIENNGLLIIRRV